MSESWGVPPWELRDAPGSLKWAARFSLYHEERNRAIENMRKT